MTDQNEPSLEISLTKLAKQCLTIDAGAVVKNAYELHEEWTKLEATMNLPQQDKEKKQKSLQKRMKAFLAATKTNCPCRVPRTPVFLAANILLLLNFPHSLTGPLVSDMMPPNRRIQFDWYIHN